MNASSVASWLRRYYLQVLAIAFVVALCVVLVMQRHEISRFKEYGYLGVFLASIASSASLIIPLPGGLVVATMGGILARESMFAPVLVGLVSAIGSTIGETTGYLAGYGGQIVLEGKPWYGRFVRWMMRRGWLTIFVLALVPNPLFDLAGMAAGALKYPWWKFFLWGTAGRIPKHIGFAYLGVLGLHIFLFP